MTESVHLDDPRHANAYENMSRGWARAVWPRLDKELAAVTVR